MRKANDVRAWLTACVPFLASAPDKLQIYLDKGTIAARSGKSLSFEYRFSLSILICDYPGSADDIVVPLLSWIEREQPDLLQHNDDAAFAFEAEILDSSCVDLLISLDITEPVTVRRRDNASGFDVSHPQEPKCQDEFYPGAPAPFRQGYAWTYLVAETKDVSAILTPSVPPQA